MIIEVGNSFSSIRGLTQTVFNRLRKVLSYTPDTGYYSGLPPRPKYLIDAKGHFPTGLLVKVEGFFKSNTIAYRIDDKRTLPRPSGSTFELNLGARKPYKDQLSALDAAVKHGRGIISMPTGSGKSVVIALIAHHFKLRTLIVVPSLEIKRQLQADLLSILGPQAPVVVENIDSSALRSNPGYDCLIIDEAHHVAAKTYHKLNKTAWQGVYHRFFLTATPYRNLEEEQLLFEAIAGQKIFELSYKDAIARGYIVPVEAYYLEVPKQTTEATTWASVYSELVVKNATRNLMVAELLGTLQATGISTLCLVKEIAHGETLSALIGVPFANGQDEDSRRFVTMFNRNEIPALIGTTGILGEGVDTRPCEYVIVAGLGKAKSAFMQQVGRGVRTFPGKESCKVILIKDRSHKFCLRHFNEQVKILKEELGVITVKLEG